MVNMIEVDGKWVNPQLLELARKEEAMPGWQPYIRLDCGGNFESNRRKSDNGWEENVSHSCWNCRHVRKLNQSVTSCDIGCMKAPDKKIMAEKKE